MTQTAVASKPAGINAASSHAAPTQAPHETTFEPGFSADLDLHSEPAIPNFVTPDNILALQHSLGNQAVQRMLQLQRSAHRPAPGTIQRDDTVVAPPPVGDQAPTPPTPVPPVPTPLAEEAPSGEPAFLAVKSRAIGPAANLTLITEFLDPAMQSMVIPALSKSILLKTRKELTSAIKGDAFLYEKLGVDKASREAALAGIMQDVATKVIARLPEVAPVIGAVKSRLSKQAMDLPVPEPDKNFIDGLGSVSGAKHWIRATSMVQPIMQKKVAFYSKEIPNLVKTYMKTNGETIVGTMNTFLEENARAKTALETQFKKELDQTLFPKGPLSDGAYSTQLPGPKYEKINYNKDNRQDYSEYTTAGLSGASSFGGGLTKKIQELGPLVGATDTAAHAVMGFGALSGGLGMVGGGLETVRGIQEMTNSSSTTGDRVSGGGRTASGISSMVQQSGAMASNIVTLTGGADSAAFTAGSVAGGGGVAMGAVDMARGGYNTYKAHQRQKQLEEIASENPASDKVKSTAVQAASTQENRKMVEGARILKGALLVAGGVTLLVLATNPVGWILMGAGALVGGIASLWRYLQKRARKKQVAIRELGVAIPYGRYKLEKEAIKKRTSMLSSERETELQKLVENNPLHLKMKSIGYKENDYAKFYADYIHDTAHILHMNGVILGGDDDPAPEHKQMRQIVQSMGLEVNSKAGTPTPEQIGKSLHM